jgi:RHS repeat-associated protein
MQMQLSSGTQIPDGILADIALGNEKPRLGVPSRNPALHQGIDASNSTIVLGLQSTVALNRIGSRSTGKERDIESGNDYFGARYYASNMGRFMSPDWSDKPEPVPYADFDNPQSLNQYSYSGNNPTSRTDPNGHCDVDGEHHGGLWCFAHALGFVETQHEQAEFARQFFANSGLVILRNGHPVDPSGESDKSLVGLLNTLRTQAVADCYNIGRCGGTPETNSGAILSALAPNITNTLQSIDATGKNLPNQAGGQTFQNRDGKLPSSDANGNSITYKEWDTEASKQLGNARSGERIVTGSDGSAYLTADHYQTFTQIR